MLLFLSPRYLLIAMAVIPAVFLMVYIYRHDRLDSESPQLLGSLVLLGIVSTLAASLLERVGEGLLSRLISPHSQLYSILLYLVVVALTEEGSKLALLYYRTWKHPEFNCQFDGVVYAVFVSLGFALWENIRYVIAYGFSTALIRAVTAVPGHACFGVFMGVWYGLAKRFERLRDEGAKRICTVLSLVVPTLIHGLYDYIAVTQSGNHEWVFLLFIAFLFFVSFRIVKYASEKDKYFPGS